MAYSPKVRISSIVRAFSGCLHPVPHRGEKSLPRGPINTQGSMMSGTDRILIIRAPPSIMASLT